jgi:hypothetical protein
MSTNCKVYYVPARCSSLQLSQIQMFSCGRLGYSFEWNSDGLQCMRWWFSTIFRLLVLKPNYGPNSQLPRRALWIFSQWNLDTNITNPTFCMVTGWWRICKSVRCFLCENFALEDVMDRSLYRLQTEWMNLHMWPRAGHSWFRASSCYMPCFMMRCQVTYPRRIKSV